jgi:hypothetical protein
MRHALVVLSTPAQRRGRLFGSQALHDTKDTDRICSVIVMLGKVKESPPKPLMDAPLKNLVLGFRHFHKLEPPKRRTDRPGRHVHWADE